MNPNAKRLIPVWRVLLSFCALACLVAGPAVAETLEVHRIFSSNMVLQREKPITVWGWATAGDVVTVQFGVESGEAEAAGDEGRWEVTFPAQPANALPQSIVVSSGEQNVTLTNVVVGDIWVMNGQSNMAFGLAKTSEADLESAQAHLPLFRRIGISANEMAEPQTRLPDSKVNGWTVSTPKTAGGFSSIGFSFGSRLQRALQIPIGIIDNARGGASIESLVPPHKFADDPVAAAYKAYLDTQIAAFDPEAVAKRKWEGQIARMKRKGVPEEKWPKAPSVASLRSWDNPAQSPSHNGSCYNGMFGVFKGLNIKGVLFHQGYNNAMGRNCRPKRYRALMRLMVEGWREDFSDQELPVGVIGFCAGGVPQTRENFEIWSQSPAAYIREAQRLGLGDVGDPDHTAFIPAYDVRVPGLHPSKKMTHAVRASRWALGEIYGLRVTWQEAALVSAEPEGAKMTLRFDKPVFPDNKSVVVEGFAIADASGKFFMARAENHVTKYQGKWGNKCDYKTVHVWSPMVQEPVTVRYAWANSPMGNLKVNGKAYQPLHSFRTDAWDWPEAGPETNVIDRARSGAMADEAMQRLKDRETEEAERAVEILEAERARKAAMAKRDGWRE